MVGRQASPFHLHADDPAEIIDPAKKGTLSILHSILEHGKDVQRVVITSSIVSIWKLYTDKPMTFTEKDWNEQAIEIVNEKGRDADGASKYGMLLLHLSSYLTLTWHITCEQDAGREGCLGSRRRTQADLGPRCHQPSVHLGSSDP